MYFDKFDICSAYYLFGMNYHSGQGSKAYAYMSRAKACGFKPGPLFCYHSLSDNGKEIYTNLLSKIGDSR